MARKGGYAVHERGMARDVDGFPLLGKHRGGQVIDSSGIGAVGTYGFQVIDLRLLSLVRAKQGIALSDELACLTVVGRNADSGSVDRRNAYRRRKGNAGVYDFFRDSWYF